MSNRNCYKLMIIMSIYIDRITNYQYPSLLAVIIQTTYNIFLRRNKVEVGIKFFCLSRL